MARSEANWKNIGQNLLKMSGLGAVATAAYFIVPSLYEDFVQSNEISEAQIFVNDSGDEVELKGPDVLKVTTKNAYLTYDFRNALIYVYGRDLPDTVMSFAQYGHPDRLARTQALGCEIAVTVTQNFENARNSHENITGGWDKANADAMSFIKNYCTPG